ncbi:MAG: D-alanyl-D-alanine carboxypeptidase/D-alanyl-D-alanine-endopeptidase [Fimbriiglobus sp.]|nr:D-alanyl-D-alanine carboxypeptidase/D-alanyl-D-alanine-endopeptidase [Fimbriiglobus sp.]
MNRPPVALLLLLLAPAAPAAEPLAKKLEAVMDAAEFKRSHWGVLFADAKTGEVIYERDADKLFTLASVSKVFSTAAALGEFGTSFRFETPVFARGLVTPKGVLLGDLILRASGDPTFGSRNTNDEDRLAFADVDHSYANGGNAALTDTDPLYAFDVLAAQIKKAGISEVTGEVLVDDRLFARTRSTGTGPEFLTPMVVNDNVIDVVVTPAGRAGERARVTHRPESSVITIDAEVSTAEPGTPPVVMLNQTGSGQYTVRGSVPAKGRPIVRGLPVDDPTALGRSLFVEALRRAGVKVAAAVARAGNAPLPAPPEYLLLPPVAVFHSAPIAELFKVTLKTSNNLYGTALPCLMAAKYGKTTQEEGLRVQQRQLKGSGLDLESVSLTSGTGGNGADLATPRATVQLLQVLRRRDDWETVRGWFPTLGVDGTLAKTVDRESPAAGKVFAKTGTYVWADTLNGRPLLKSKSLAGMVVTESGRELLFAVFVNDVPLGPNLSIDKVGRVLARLCEIVHADRPER